MARTSPTLPASQMTRPSAGEGISTVALSVMTAPSTASSRTVSPTFTCHSTSSASAIPSPTSGSLTTRSAISGLQRFDQRAADPRRSREVIPFLRMRVRRIPAGDANDRCLQMIEAPRLDQRAELGTESRGQRRLMHDDAASSLRDRSFDGVEIERQQRAKIDDLGVNAGLGRGGLGDINHRAVSKDGDGVTLPANRGVPERN